MAQEQPTTNEYAEIARQCEPQLLRHALRLCGGNLDWASDLTQDALIAGFAQSQEGKLDLKGNVKAWLMRVVTTRFINEFNRRKKWTSDVEVAKLDDHVSVDFQTEDPYFDEPLEKALSQLPEDQRTSVLLVDVEEMSYAEASELIGVPVGTVRSRLARGRLRLYTLLMPYAQSRGIL